MARDYARTNVTIWQDPDFRSLPYPAQMLYYMLWTHPELSYCGVIDWRPAKLTGSGAGWTKPDLLACAACLEARHFIVIDTDTEECLVRSWVRWDGLIRQPRLAVSFANAYAAVGSNLVRGVIIHELNKLRLLEPEAAGWAKPQVKAMVDLPSINPKVRDTVRDPFSEGFVIGFGSVSSGVSEAFSPNATKGFGSVSLPPTPSPAPTPLLQLHKESPAYESEPAADDQETPRKRGRALPENWKPDKTVIDAMHEEFPELDLKAEHAKFADHWKANGKPMKDWNATWRNWIRRSAEFAANRPANGKTFKQAADDEIFANAMAWARDLEASQADDSQKEIEE